MIKAISRLGLEGTYLNIIKVIYDERTANTMFSIEKLKVFLGRPGTRQGWSLLPLFFNVVLEVLARIVKQDKQIKSERKK